MVSCVARMGKRMSREHLFASPLKCEGNALPLGPFPKEASERSRETGRGGQEKENTGMGN